MIHARRFLLAAALATLPPLAAPLQAQGVVFSFGVPYAYPAYPYPYAYYPPAYYPPAYYPPAYYPPAYHPPRPFIPRGYAPGAYGVAPAYPQANASKAGNLPSGPVAGDGAGRACIAGALTCAPDASAATGDACSCPTPGNRRAWGRVG